MKNTITKTRNYSIDLFKIFSMFMVVIIHVFNGIILGCTPGTANEYIAIFLETSVLTAVNCFALSSGFILINVKYKFSRIIYMWFQVVFYSVLISAFFFILFPTTCSKGTMLQSFFPVLSANRYWYFSAYFVLFLLMPYINILLNSITQKHHLILNIILFVVFSIFPTIAFTNSTYFTYQGYSAFWLIVIYVWGAYFGKYGINTKFTHDILAFAICTAVAFLDRFEFFMSDLPILSNIAKTLKLANYDSPTLVIASIALLSAFSKINISKPMLIKFIHFASPLTFSVYLIHNHQLIRNEFMLKYLPIIGQQNILAMISISFGLSIGIFVVCMLIDWLRLKLFNLIRIRLLSEKIGKYIEQSIKKIVNKVISS